MFRLDSNVYSKGMRPSDYFRMNQQTEAQAQQSEMNELKIKEAKQQQAGKLLSIATPENWGQIRSQAIREGLGNENLIPETYDQGWIDKTKSAFGSSSSNVPSGVAEYNYVKNLSPSEQERYLSIKRNPQYLNLGDGFFNPNAGRYLAKGIAPEKQPDFKAEQSAAMQDAKNESDLEYKPNIEREKLRAKERGKDEDLLASMQSKLPQLEATVRELGELGKVATYTRTGQLKDATLREFGAKMSEGAKARAEYIAKVNNQILPLLRDTFGAQFTEREGQTLKDTLGDPNKSPEEKDAVLNAFITQKRRDIGALQNKVSGRRLSDIFPSNNSGAPTIQEAGSSTIIDFNDLPD